jgi:hypothetical protein
MKQSPHYKHLKNKWSKRHEKLQKKVWAKHGSALDWVKRSSQQFMAGSLASLLMFVTPVATTSAQFIRQMPQEEPAVDKPARTASQLIADLSSVLPKEVAPLTQEQERNIGQKLTEYFNMPVSAELQGKRLNRSYGLIGAEQHLMRYPGDTIDTHFNTPEEAKYISSGMAPGRGAWGYFAPSREAMTEKDVAREKYYLAVQTFLAPGWNDDVNGHYNFFKYRKMLVVNAENGKAMVVIIGDAGPAEFTGKHLGGSPEVMGYLERQDGGAKGPVLYFFIDDPEDKIPLGPIAIPK